MDCRHVCMITCLFTSLLLAVATAEDPPRLSVSITAEIAHVGDDVTLTCTVSPYTSSTIIHWIKGVFEVEDRYQAEMIATETSLTKTYKQLGRFTATSETEGNDKIYILSVTGVTTEDSGHYACKEINIENLYSTVPFEVYHTPSSLELSDGENNDTLILRENKAAKLLTCVGDDVVPLPHMAVYVGNNDVTNKFLLLSKTNVMCLGQSEVGKLCPLHFTYTAIIENRVYAPQYTDDEKQMTCSMTMKHHPYDVINVTKSIVVLYAPKIQCVDHFAVSMNATNVKLTCTVMYNPHPEELVWIVPHEEQQWITMRTGDKNADYSTSQIVQGEKSSTVHLTISRIRKWILDQKIRLNITNEMGNTMKNIKLIERSTPTDSSGSVLGAGLTALMTSLLCVLRVMCTE